MCNVILGSMFRHLKFALVLAFMVLLTPSVQGMFLPSPVPDASSYFDKIQEGPYWRTILDPDVPLTKYSIISDIAGTPEGNILLAGTNVVFIGLVDDEIYHSKRGYVAKMTADGELLWEQTIGNHLELYGCIAVREDLYLLLGRGLDASDESQIILLAIDGSGYLLWENIIESDANDSAFDMQQDKNGDIYIAGHTDTDNGYDGLLMKFDADGNLLWRRTYDDGEHEMFTKMALTSGGNIILMGSTKWFEFLPTQIPHYSNVLVVSYDADGNLKWSVSRGGESDYTVPLDMEVGPDDLIAITGFNSDSKREQEDILFMLVDDEGNILNFESYPGLYDNDDDGYCIFRDQQGTFVIFGESGRWVPDQLGNGWYMTDPFYSIVDEEGEVRAVSMIDDDLPDTPTYIPACSFLDQNGRLHIVYSSYNEYRIFIISFTDGDSVSFTTLVHREFPS